MQRFDLFNSTPTNVVPTTETTPPPATHTNGASASPAVKRETNGTSKKRSSPTTDDNESEDDALSSVADTPPPAKRTKIEKAGKETDEEYARRLQAELNRVQGRSTRGGGATTKRKPAPKQRKKKSKATVGSDEDSDVEGGEKKGVKRTGGFHVRFELHYNHWCNYADYTMRRNPWPSQHSSPRSSTKHNYRDRRQ